MHPRKMEESCSIIPKAPAGGLHLLRALLIPAGQQGLARSPVPAIMCALADYSISHRLFAAPCFSQLTWGSLCRLSLPCSAAPVMALSMAAKGMGSY